MVIAGPSQRMRVTATQTPASAATMGTIHTSEIRVLLLLTARASGALGSIVSSGMAYLRYGHRIPDQTRIERLDRQHREHDDRREEEHAGRRLHRQSVTGGP